jgi:ATP-dependent Lon protease
MGDVMKESIRVAFTKACTFIEQNPKLIESKIVNEQKTLNNYIKENFPCGFHVHAPEGATPKDGPSAGAAFTVCFISVLLKHKVRRDIAMTGEINLAGEVTKIGGLVYKLIGAKYAGVKLALVPKSNESDLEDIKTTHADLFNKNFKCEFISKLSDVVKYTLPDMNKNHITNDE